MESLNDLIDQSELSILEREYYIYLKKRIKINMNDNKI